MVEESGLVELRCAACGALIAIAASQRTERCPFCDVPSVVTRGATPTRLQPTFALGFVVERDEASRVVTDWIRRRRMAPFGLKRGTAERITGIYLPAYLYSATARSEYRASIGETYRALGLVENADGRTSLGRREKTEYHELTGRHVGYVADVLVTASRTLSNPEVEAIEPFDFGRLQRYTPALIAGWTSEEPSVPAQESLGVARAEAHGFVRRSLHDFMPGDEVRSLQHQTEFVDESIELALVPVWVCAVRYHPQKKSVRILVNGQTGKVAGAVPVSWAKVALVAGSIVLIAAAAVVGLIALNVAIR